MLFNINVSDRHVKLLRWAVQVATDAVVAQSEANGLPKDEAMLIIDQLADMEDHVINQVIEIIDKDPDAYQLELPI